APIARSAPGASSVGSSCHVLVWLGNQYFNGAETEVVARCIWVRRKRYVSDPFAGTAHHTIPNPDRRCKRLADRCEPAEEEQCRPRAAKLAAEAFFELKVSFN